MAPRESAAPAPVIDALAWVHVRDRRLLCVRTIGLERYYLPGGKREPGESDEAAVAREVAEETGVELVPGTIAPFAVVDEAADNRPAGTRVRLSCYTADHTGEPAPANEIADLAWLAHADRDRCAPAVRRVLDLLRERDLVD
ncbi:NUDIX domain-containing protein [Streptomonospora nanhaiensis]|uniref:8-oxo-dGTP pyrophosphatase MutT (NUDIX family) n=1 Tax=Streptomonospora nanhaiensis TaxID=1323731 RepID=A0A853BQ40_9ACTN|nr:NUDIX domain-containing protein [Streptomonospora nanhaiensis]MBV2363916.1 NUDIX domain-containing protein [Streptomonospora nanhaiensis]MBX9388735.1 NUDIX domain-containing protein [Streptomonospora nanhaiensis]NYI96776.1 8-oxo-dGTP pyrophosphatase MutT (NUDIX family) [Streptomonospora nanhaiensis]